ncbi:winged helix-turn-helix domain-containing protein [Terracidiphilus gabretensis]|uniref:winged helix-turn-helix domain-containing protein n=1 Tax=Terracidiphilus gabretensis TaxID=1577687 RepID=UPI001E4777D8|nr:winged helix-turn-helix domain-containing protein [Terracidiphilus gabretensis]
MLEAKSHIRFEGYVIDRLSWTLRWAEEPIALNRKSFDVLLYLVEHRNRVVSKDELLETVWAGQFVEESNLTQQVFLLRKALSRHQSGIKIIETVPGRGYRFAAPVEIEPLPVSHEQVQQQIVLSTSQSITRITLEEKLEEDETEVGRESARLPAAARKRNPVVVASAACALAVALAAGGWFGWQRWLDRTGGAPIDVVLTPMDGSTGDKILDRTLDDALRIDLSQSPFVSVVSPARVRLTLGAMMRKPDEAMTPAIWREICERTNSQAVLRGTVARVGQHFLVTEDATSCVNGAVLAEAKREAATPEELPQSIDKLAESLRQELGESRRSIARFDTPLFPENTPSLEALKDYSQANILGAQGKYTDAIALLKNAITIDPNFAGAYFSLAANQFSTNEFAEERKSISTAFRLRNTASEPVRLEITALYHSTATQNLYEAERNYRTWTELYPRSGPAWSGLSAVQRDLGRNADSLISEERALELRPDVQGMYTNLTFEQRMAGDPKAAIATLDRAIARGLDGDNVRGHYLESAYVLHDTALMQKQRDWAAAHPDAVYFRMVELQIATAEGRLGDAQRLLAQSVALLRTQGDDDRANGLIWNEGANLVEEGDVADGTRLIRSVPADPKDEDSIVGLARVGDFAAAEAAIHAMQAEFPEGTIWNDYRGPEVQALADMAAHKPADAVAALERTRPLDARDPLTTLLRADAYREAGENALAEKQYHVIVDYPLQNSDTEEQPLSWLGLGRTLAAEGNRAAAIDAYQHFLALWSHADPDALFLRQANRELAALKTPPSAK